MFRRPELLMHTHALQFAAVSCSMSIVATGGAIAGHGNKIL